MIIAMGPGESNFRLIAGNMSFFVFSFYGVSTVILLGFCNSFYNTLRLHNEKKKIVDIRFGYNDYKKGECAIA